MRITTVEDCVVVVAPDVKNRRRDHDSMVSVAALGYLLEQHLGVRWLWPGELGTVVPRTKTIRIPRLDVRHQPFPETRQRIAFLRDGLTQVQLTADVMRNKGEQQAAAIQAMLDFTREADERHGYWGANGLARMKHWGAIGRDVTLDSM